MTSCGSFSAKTVEGKQTVRLTRIVGPGVSVQVSGFSSDFLTPEASYAILCSLTTEREHGMAHGKSKLQIYYDLFDSVKFREKSVVKPKTELLSWLNRLLFKPNRRKPET